MRARIVYFDLLRCLAILLVIVLHSVANIIVNPAFYQLPSWYLCMTVDPFDRAAVPLFFMISGALFLNHSKSGRIWAFYRHNIPKLVVPLAAWSLIYYIYNSVRENTPLSAEHFFGLLFGPGVSFHMWFIYSLLGLYLLCVTDGLGSVRGSDLMVLACAVVFAVHIQIIDRFAPLVDGVRMSCIQFFVCGAIALVLTFIFEKPDFSALLAAWGPVLYAGVMSSGVGYTLQIIGQKYTNPTVASMILSLESVFAVLGGIVILGQMPAAREIVGCCVMFAAIVIAQLPEKKRAA